MNGKYKKFNKTSFDTNDSPARKCAIKHLPSIMKAAKPETYGEIKIVENEDKYGPDLLCFNDDNLIGYFEPEVKRVWSSAKFPYQDLQIPERKRKWAKGHKGLPVTFCVLNKSLTQMATVSSLHKHVSTLQEVPNKEIASGELFFKVPLTAVKFHKLK